MSRGNVRVPLLLSAALAIGAAPPAKPPAMKLNTCVSTRLKTVTARLEDGQGRPIVNSGTSVVLANGIYGVSYDAVPAARASRIGDPVLACLVRLPTHCPPGDERGKWYTTTNLRTMKSWTLPDAQHLCGGA